jgi:hypothetical protein
MSNLRYFRADMTLWGQLSDEQVAGLLAAFAVDVERIGAHLGGGFVETDETGEDLAAADAETPAALKRRIRKMERLLRDSKHVIELTGKGLGLAVDGRTISTTVLLAEIDAALAAALV